MFHWDLQKVQLHRILSRFSMKQQAGVILSSDFSYLKIKKIFITLILAV